MIGLVVIGALAWLAIATAGVIVLGRVIAIADARAQQRIPLGGAR